MRKWILAVMLFWVLMQPNWAFDNCNGKQMLGRVEKVLLTNKEIQMDAKLDTGADMSSLSAQHIELFKSNHQTWVRFHLKLLGEKNYMLTAPLIKMTRILKRKDEQQEEKYSQRPVIKLGICLGGIRKTIWVNLVDRSNFKYPMLLGLNALKKFNVVVDVSQDHLATSLPCAGII